MCYTTSRNCAVTTIHRPAKGGRERVCVCGGGWRGALLQCLLRTEWGVDDFLRLNWDGHIQRQVLITELMWAVFSMSELTVFLQASAEYATLTFASTSITCCCWFLMYLFIVYWFIITQAAEIHRATCRPASFSIQLRCVHIVIKGLVSWQHSYRFACSYLDRSPIHAEGSSKFCDIRTMSSTNTPYDAAFLCRWQTISVVEKVTPEQDVNHLGRLLSPRTLSPHGH